jgi:predicted histone-like DNA-binding protein
MPIFYNKVQKVNPRNVEGLRLWYPVVKSTKLVRERELAAKLADETTLNPKEAEMAIYQLFKAVTDLLSTGHTVQLGDLGSFRVTAVTESSETEAEVNASKIKKLNVRFSESENLRAAMEKAELKDLASLAAKVNS